MVLLSVSEVLVAEYKVLEIHTNTHTDAYTHLNAKQLPVKWTKEHPIQLYHLSLSKRSNLALIG